MNTTNEKSPVLEVEGAPRIDVAALSQPIAAVIPAAAALFGRDVPVKRHNGKTYRLLNRVRVLEQKGTERTPDEMNETRELLYEIARFVCVGVSEAEILELDAVQVGVIIGIAGADIEAIERLRATIEARRVGEAVEQAASGEGGEGNAVTTEPVPTAPPSSEA